MLLNVELAPCVADLVLFPLAWCSKLLAADLVPQVAAPFVLVVADLVFGAAVMEAAGCWSVALDC